MKIWLDTTFGSFLKSGEYTYKNDLIHHEYAGECECSQCGDCGSVRRSTGKTNLSVIPKFHEDIYYHMQICRFKQTASLYLQRCDHERWLVCNPTASGHIAVVDQQAIAILEKFRSPLALLDLTQEIQDCSLAQLEGIIRIFASLGFLQDIAHPQLSENHSSSQTLSAWLHVTNACNLRCHYCYLDKTSEHMDTSTAYRAVDAIFRSAGKYQYQRVQLKYAGGEASLQSARVMAIHDYATLLADQHNIELSAYIMSNGVALPQRIIDGLKTRSIGIMISLDGVGRDHDCQRPFISGQGSFKYVDRTITRLLASDLIPSINVTVSQRNLEGLPALMGYLLAHDLPFRLSYYRDNDCASAWSNLQFKNEQMIAAMLRAFDVLKQHLPQRRLISSLIDLSDMTGTHEYTCGVGRNYLVIDQYGGIAKCHADIERTITTIDADDPLQVIRTDRDGVQGVSVEEKEGCRTCEWRYWCTGGCPLLTYRVTGRYDIKSPNCAIYKALYPEALRLEAMRLLRYEPPIVL